MARHQRSSRPVSMLEGFTAPLFSAKSLHCLPQVSGFYPEYRSVATFPSTNGVARCNIDVGGSELTHHLSNRTRSVFTLDQETGLLRAEPQSNLLRGGLKRHRILRDEIKLRHPAPAWKSSIGKEIYARFPEPCEYLRAFPRFIRDFNVEVVDSPNRLWDLPLLLSLKFTRDWLLGFQTNPLRCERLLESGGSHHPVQSQQRRTADHLQDRRYRLSLHC